MRLSFASDSFGAICDGTGNRYGDISFFFQANTKIASQTLWLQRLLLSSRLLHGEHGRGEGGVLKSDFANIAKYNYQRILYLALNLVSTPIAEDNHVHLK